jgi:hypothetical protein
MEWRWAGWGIVLIAGVALWVWVSPVATLLLAAMVRTASAGAQFGPGHE